MIDEYQEFTRTTAIYPKADTGEVEALAYVALGLAGESGEIANKVKKLLRDGDSMQLRTAIATELGDVCWYVARLADELAVSLSGVIAANRAKLSDRQSRGVLGGSGDQR